MRLRAQGTGCLVKDDEVYVRESRDASTEGHVSIVGEPHASRYLANAVSSYRGSRWVDVWGRLKRKPSTRVAT